MFMLPPLSAVVCSQNTTLLLIKTRDELFSAGLCTIEAVFLATGMTTHF